MRANFTGYFKTGKETHGSSETHKPYIWW